MRLLLLPEWLNDDEVMSWKVLPQKELLLSQHETINASRCPFIVEFHIQSGDMEKPIHTG